MTNEIEELKEHLEELNNITDGPESEPETQEIGEEKELIVARLQQLEEI